MKNTSLYFYWTYISSNLNSYSRKKSGKKHNIYQETKMAPDTITIKLKEFKLYHQTLIFFIVCFQYTTKPTKTKTKTVLLVYSLAVVYESQIVLYSDMFQTWVFKVWRNTEQVVILVPDKHSYMRQVTIVTLPQCSLWLPVFTLGNHGNQTPLFCMFITMVTRPDCSLFACTHTIDSSSVCNRTVFSTFDMLILSPKPNALVYSNNHLFSKTNVIWAYSRFVPFEYFTKFI